MQPRVSVIMPTHDKSAYLERTLASWAHQPQGDYELLVVDDGSTDATARVIEEYARILPLHCTRTSNQGRSAARNRALELARGEIVVFSDDDRLVPSTFLQAHLQYFDDPVGSPLVFGWQHGLLTEVRPARPGAVVASGHLCLSHPSARQRLEEALSRGETFELVQPSDVRENLERILLEHRAPERFFEAKVVPAFEAVGEDIHRYRFCWAYGASGNMAVQRSKLLEIGGFETAFRGWGMEDTELCYRLVHAGCRARLSKDAANYHQNHRRDREREVLDWLRNALIFLSKHDTAEVGIYLRCALHGLTQSTPGRPSGAQRPAHDRSDDQREELLAELLATEGTRLASEFQRLLRSDVRWRLQAEIARRDP